MPPRRPARSARNQDLAARKRAAFRPPFVLSLRFREASGERETVEVHHLGPCRHEIPGELLLRVRAAIDLREGAELRVRTEHQIDTGAGPLDRIGLAVAA